MAAQERSVESEMRKNLGLEEDLETNMGGNDPSTFNNSCQNQAFTLGSTPAPMNVPQVSQQSHIVDNGQMIWNAPPLIPVANQDFFGLNDIQALPVGNIKELNANFSENIRFEKNIRQTGKFWILSNKIIQINNQSPVKLSQKYFNQLPPDIDPRLKNMAYSLVADIKLSPITALCSSLSAIGGACWNRYKLKVSDTHTEPLSLYVAVIAPPSSGKTTLSKRLSKPFEKFRDEITKIYDENKKDAEELKKTLEAQLRNFRKKVDYDDLESLKEHRARRKRYEKNFNVALNNPYKHRPSIYCKYITDKGLVKILEKNGGQQIIISDEAGAWKEYLKKEENLDLLLTAWSDWEYSRTTAKGEPASIPATSLNLLLMSQANVIDFVFQDKNLIDRGFPQRFIHLYDEGIQQTGCGSYSDVRDEYNSVVMRLLSRCYTQDLNATKDVLYMDIEAVQIYRDFESHVQSQKLKDVPESFIEKLLQMTIRFSGIIHIYFNLEGPEKRSITGKVMRQAISISKCLYQSIGYYYSDDGFLAYTNALKVYQYLSKLTDYEKQKHLINIGIPLREIMPYVHLKKDKFMPALALLEKHNLLTFGENIDGKEVVVVRRDFWSRINAIC